MRSEHPLIVALVEALARECGVDPKVLWDALDGKPSPRRFVEFLVYQFHPQLSADDFVIEGSTSVANGDRIATNMQTESQIVGVKPTDHPFTRALRRKGLTLAEWAHTHDVPRPTVSSWFLAGTAPRRIPRSMAEAIKKELGVPLTAWTNGIREGK